MKYTLFTYHDSLLVDGLRAASIINDDASSTSSSNTTIPATVIGLPLTKSGTMKQFPKRNEAKKRPSIRVHFDESQNTAFENNQLYMEDDKKIRWYSGMEIQKFKQATKILVDEILYAERKSHTQRSLWGNHLYTTPSYSKVMQHTFQACCLCKHELDDTAIRFLASADEKRLHQEMLKDTERKNCIGSSMDDEDTTRWGIERKVLDTVMGDDFRFGRRRKMQNLVFSVQHLDASSIPRTHKSSQSDLLADDDGMVSNEQVAEYIREACQKRSRPSRLFARQMALSLAATINN